jgi:hypothetical protein
MQVFKYSVALWLHLVNGTSGPRSSTKVHGCLCTLVTTSTHYRAAGRNLGSSPATWLSCRHGW